MTGFYTYPEHTPIMPVNRESHLACVRLGRCRDRLEESSGAPDSLEISGQSSNANLVGPVDETDRRASRVIDVQSVGHMDEGHAQVHWDQFDIRLILIKDHPIHSSLREGIRKGRK